MTGICVGGGRKEGTIKVEDHLMSGDNLRSDFEPTIHEDFWHPNKRYQSRPLEDFGFHID